MIIRRNTKHVESRKNYVSELRVTTTYRTTNEAFLQSIVENTIASSYATVVLLESLYKREKQSNQTFAMNHVNKSTLKTLIVLRSMSF